MDSDFGLKLACLGPLGFLFCGSLYLLTSCHLPPFHTELYKIQVCPVYKSTIISKPNQLSINNHLNEYSLWSWFRIVNSFQVFMPYSAWTAIKFKGLQADRFYNSKMPSSEQYFKQNEWGLGLVLRLKSISMLCSTLKCNTQNTTDFLALS